MSYIAVAGPEAGEMALIGIAGLTNIAGKYDTNRVRNSVRTTATDTATLSFPAYAEVWAVFSYHPDTSVSSTTYLLEIKPVGANGVRLGSSTTNAHKVEYWNGSAWTDTGLTVTLASATRHRVCIRVKAGASGIIQITVGGTLVADWSGDLSGITNFAELVCNCNYQVRGNPYYCYWSEFIIGTHDVSQARLNYMNLTADGALAQWEGAVGDINPFNTTNSTFISAETAGLKDTYVAADPYNDSLDIAAVVISGVMRRNETGPTGINALVRHGGVDYGQSVGTLTQTFVPKQIVHAVNPATSAPWVRTDVNALEIGVEAVA